MAKYDEMTTDEKIKHTLWRYSKGMINYYEMKRTMKKLLNKKED